MPKKDSDRKRRKREANKARQKARARAKLDKAKTVERLCKVFGGQTEDFLRLASDGKTPGEIAQSLGVPIRTVESFIEAFASLPGGIDRHLLDSPELLAEDGPARLMVRSMLREARSRRNFR